MLVVQVYDWLLTISRLPDDLLTPDLKHYVTGKQLYTDKVEAADLSSFYFKTKNNLLATGVCMLEKRRDVCECAIVVGVWSDMAALP